MAIKEELSEKVGEFAGSKWSDIPNAYVIPGSGDLSFGNSGERLNVTVLYADIRGSTPMVDATLDTLAAEYYKAFLHCASQLIKRNDGEIQAYDGDRVMAIYVGDNQADNAVGTAFELNYAVSSIINPAFAKVYGEHHRVLKHTVGIDSGKVLAIKVGLRAVGELAWIGGAANYAAKLNSFDGLDDSFPTRVTTNTWAKLTRKSLYDDAGEILWAGKYNNLKQRLHYRSDGVRVLP